MPLPTVRRRVRIRLRGIVQGVGFRPFVHNLARELKLGGYVLNSSAGLVAEVEGDPAAVERFIQAVTQQPPPLAWVQEAECSELDALGEESFAIRPSAAVTGEFALVSPDVATNTVKGCWVPASSRCRLSARKRAPKSLNAAVGP